MIIAFMGNDGSGKTTLATHVYKRFLELDSSVEYEQEFKYFFVKYIMKLLGRKTENIRKVFLSQKNARDRSLTFKLWPYVVWSDYLFFWLYLKIFKREKIIIFDRYVYDFLISWEYLGYKSDFLRKLYLIFPKPNLSIVCIVSPKIAYMRKFRLDFSFYEVQTRRYLEIAKNLRIKVVDTSKPIEETLHEIMNFMGDAFSWVN